MSLFQNIYGIFVSVFTGKIYMQDEARKSKRSHFGATPLISTNI